MSKRLKASSEPSDESSGSENFLAKLTSKELKSIKVSVPRHDVLLESGGSSVFQRSLDDPTSLVIPRREGEGQNPIFDRKGIIVNDHKHLEERIVKKSPINSSTEDDRSDRSRSNSYSDRSEDSYRSSNSKNQRAYSKSPLADHRKDFKKKGYITKDYHKNLKVSPYKNRQRDDYREKRKVNKSASPIHIKSEGVYDNKHALSKERHHKERSPTSVTSRSSRERDRGIKGSRNYESGSYRDDRNTSSRVDYKHSPKRYDRNKSRSNSPRKPSYAHSDKERYSRVNSPSTHPKRYSTSPHSKRSRSPYSRKRSHSPPSKKRGSRSPHMKRSPREERGYSSMSSSSRNRRRSGSYERDKEYPSGSSHYSSHTTPYSKRSRSPHHRKYSRSPYRSDSSNKYKRRSHSPYRRDSEGYRPRSRSPRRMHKHSESKERSYRKSPPENKAEYGVLPPDFNFYGAEGYWFPGPLPRPGYIPRGVIPPPVAISRGMVRPGPAYIFPRPYIPMHPHPVHSFRPRFSGPYRPRPRLNVPTATITDVSNNEKVATNNTATTAENTSTVLQEPATSSNIASVPAIEDFHNEAENAKDKNK